MYWMLRSAEKNGYASVVKFFTIGFYNSMGRGGEAFRSMKNSGQEPIVLKNLTAVAKLLSLLNAAVYISIHFSCFAPLF